MSALGGMLPAWLNKRGSLIRALLAISCVLAVVAPPQVDTADALVRLDCARSILWRGTLALEKEHAESQLSPLGSDGRRYCIYPIGQSLVLVPLEAGAAAVLAVFGKSANEYLRDVLVALQYLTSVTLLSALATFWVMRRLGLSQRSAALGLVVCFCTTQWIVWSRSMQEEVLAGTLLLATLGCILEARTSRYAFLPLCAGALLGLLANIRYNAAFPALGLVAWSFFALGDRRNWIRFWFLSAATLTPWLMLSGWYNFARFGDVFRSGYAAADIGGSLLAWSFDVGSLLNWVCGADFGVLWFWAPIGVLLALRARHRHRRRDLACCLALALAAHVGVLSGFSHGAGVHGCVGPRFVCHHMMLMLPLVWVAFRGLTVGGSPALARPSVAVLAFSFAIQFCCLPLSAGLENMQHLARTEAGLEPCRAGYLPCRAANLVRLLRNDLLAYSYPPELHGRVIANVNTSESFRVAANPSLLPWRVSGGIRARQMLPTWVAWVAGAVWSLLVICAGWLLYRVACRKLRAKVGAK